MIDKLRVCGKDYKIIYVKEPTLKGKKMQSTIYEDLGLIKIKNWSKDWKVECLLHEALHSISNTFNLGFTEQQTTLLAPAIQILLKENPKLMEMLK